MRAQENERARVAVDIYDGPLQKAIILTKAEGSISEDRIGLSRDLVAELREISSRLRPSILDDLGLVPAIEWLLEGLSSRSELATSLSLHGVDEDDRLHAPTELALFRVTQEAINNVLKHAEATRLDVSLSRGGGVLVLRVADDGIGFSPTLHNNGGVGLSGMRERVIHLDGTFEASSAPGAGTTVIARVPSERDIALGYPV